MSLWIVLPGLLLISLCQVTFLPLVAVGGLKIDLALILVVAWGLVGNLGEAVLWGFILGLGLDLASGLPFGAHTIALTGVGALMFALRSSSFRDNLLLPPIAVLAATLGQDLFYLFVLQTLNPTLFWGDYLWRLTLPSAILNMLILPCAYLPFRWIASRRV